MVRAILALPSIPILSRTLLASVHPLRYSSDETAVLGAQIRTPNSSSSALPTTENAAEDDECPFKPDLQLAQVQVDALGRSLLEGQVGRSPRCGPDRPLALDGLRVSEVVLDVDDAHPGVPGDPAMNLVSHGTVEEDVERSLLPGPPVRVQDDDPRAHCGVGWGGR